VIHSGISGKEKAMKREDRGSYKATARFTALLCIVALGNLQALSAESPTAINIVYILADDLGYGELGCYGQTKIRTPHLDRMAAEGMKFNQHYSGAPVCAPARCVLMSGRHSGHASIRDNIEHKPEGQAPMFGREQTLAEVLAPAGYVSGCFGKWGLGYPGSEGDPLQQGFDRFYGYNCQRHAHNFYPRYLWSDSERVELPGNDRKATGAHYSHDLIEREALAFLREHREHPFFCYVPFTIPHLALQVPDASLNDYLGRWEETPYLGKSYLQHPTPRSAYAAMITHLDRSVGRILELLDELDLTRKTLVMFASDNGVTHLGPDQVDFEFFDSSAGLRGFKGSVFEGGLRVPLIARWPGKISSGSITEHVSAFQDVLPTLAELAGVEVPAEADGLSFLPTLLGQPEKQPQHEYLFWDFPGYGGQLAVRFGDFKAVRRGLRKQPDAPLQLFDLSKDPAESTDVAAQHPEIVARIQEIMRSARTQPEYEGLRFGEYGGSCR
jgi:arylsulfatase